MKYVSAQRENLAKKTALQKEIAITVPENSNV
jgi:hypothetical protein